MAWAIFQTVSLYLMLGLKRTALQGGAPLTWADRVTWFMPALLMVTVQPTYGALPLTVQTLGWGLCLVSLWQLQPGTVAVTGPYRWVRHPMYTGYLVWLAGIIADQPLHWLGFNALVWVWLCWGLCQRLTREESALTANTGPAYDQYRLNCPYRLLPGVY